MPSPSTMMMMIFKTWARRIGTLAKGERRIHVGFHSLSWRLVVLWMTMMGISYVTVDIIVCFTK